MIRECLLALFGLLVGIVVCPADISTEQSEFEGDIGIALTRAKDSRFLTVEYVATNSPAFDAGIEKGDTIVAIDEIPTPTMSLDEAWHFRLGNVGGTVTLTVRRAGVADTVISVIRRSIPDAYTQAAMEDDPRAEFYLGEYYEQGPIHSRNYAVAAFWLREVGLRGNARAQAQLGYMYLEGLGVPKDYKTAVQWF